jgi:putative ABC transport system substrate-binding protein
LFDNFESGHSRNAISVSDGCPVVPAPVAIGGKADEIRRGEVIAPSLAGLGGTDLAVYVPSDTLVRTNALGINTLALAARLPTLYDNQEQVEAGA